MTGANGGVGTALLELLQVLGITAYGYCRPQHFALVEKFGARPIEDKRSDETVDAAVKRVVPEGVDCAFDVLGGYKAAQCLHAVKKGGTLVGYGFTAACVGKKASTYLAVRGILTW